MYLCLQLLLWFFRRRSDHFSSCPLLPSQDNGPLQMSLWMSLSKRHSPLVPYPPRQTLPSWQVSLHMSSVPQRISLLTSLPHLATSYHNQVKWFLFFLEFNNIFPITFCAYLHVILELSRHRYLSCTSMVTFLKTGFVCPSS